MYKNIYIKLVNPNRKRIANSDDDHKSNDVADEGVCDEENVEEVGEGKKDDVEGDGEREGNIDVQPCTNDDEGSDYDDTNETDEVS